MVPIPTHAARPCRVLGEFQAAALTPEGWLQMSLLLSSVERGEALGLLDHIFLHQKAGPTSLQVAQLQLGGSGSLLALRELRNKQ